MISKTGNTKNFANHIYIKMKSNYETKLLKTNHINEKTLDDYDLLIVGFWGKRATADPLSLSLFKKIKNKKIILFGTLGANPNSEHGLLTRKNSINELSLNNEVLDCFLLNGLVSKTSINSLKLVPSFIVSKELKNKMIETSKKSRKATPEEIEVAVNKIYNLVLNI